MSKTDIYISDLDNQYTYRRLISLCVSRNRLEKHKYQYGDALREK